MFKGRKFAMGFFGLVGMMTIGFTPVFSSPQTAETVISDNDVPRISQDCTPAQSIDKDPAKDNDQETLLETSNLEGAALPECKCICCWGKKEMVNPLKCLKIVGPATPSPCAEKLCKKWQTDRECDKICPKS